MEVAYRWDNPLFAELAGEQILGFADEVRDADMATRVPTCPEWTLADLVSHCGRVHRWATQMVRDNAQKRLERRDIVDDLPDDPAEYAAWLAAGAAPLVATFRAADPDAPMWGWGADRHARFWPRRMVHETAIHRADARIALGGEPTGDMASEVAADGIDELLANLSHAAYFAPGVTELRGDGALALAPTDHDERWRVVLGPEGYDWDRGPGPAAVTVAGPVAELELLLYGRLTPDTARGVAIDGDRSLLDHWLSHSSL